MFASIQQQFTSYWNKQSLGKKITMVSLILAALILTPVLVNWATSPSYVTAYSGLSETDAAAIVQKLDDNSIPYQLKNTGTILVPSSQVYSARLLMAREGLPQSSTVGYELFSGTAMLGMTEFSQKVNYQRAVEGELQRTIGSLEAVKSVRVHLVTPEKTLLSSDQALSTASVTIQVAPGRSLDAAQVRSITHLVASSVEGMKPENVVVVDSAGNMLADGNGEGSNSSMAQKSDQRTAELAYAAEVQKRVQTILDKILGPNKSVVQATVEMDWTQREVTSNTYAPTEVAIRSSQIINESSSSGSTAGGVTGSGASDYKRNEETLNYEVSQVQSHEVVAPGKVSRVSVSVMVDGINDQAQMDTIKSAVEVAAGIDTTRGDQIGVESYAFDRTAADALTAELALQQQQELYMQIGIAVGVAVVLLALLFIVLRMISNLRKASKESWKTVLRPVGEMAAMQDTYVGPALQQPSGAMPAVIAALSANSQANNGRSDDDVVVQLTPKNPNSTASVDEQRSRVISRLTEDNPATVAEIIQIWLSESKR
ncbi:MAG: flagellar basal-body MS-ring/collar protein FliF [Chloroflexi bacterium]|nr:flagellar basal-body MS-ring/collar protein FliF [Chloroflexota bacterium]